MGTIEKHFLSGSTAGEPIPVGNAGDTTRATIHIPVDEAIDEVWLWAANNSGSAITLTIEHGQQGIDHQYRQSVDAGNGWSLVCQGLTLSGSGEEITAYSASSSGIVIAGFVNRIDQTS